jgi:hypothetical protein
LDFGKVLVLYYNGLFGLFEGKDWILTAKQARGGGLFLFSDC